MVHPYFMTLHQRNYYPLLFIISIVALVLIALISQASASNIFFPNKADFLRSASELDYPPFSIIRPDGTADGFSVELLTEVTKAAGLKVEFKVGPWNKIKQELIEGKLDVLPIVSYSEERDKVLDFTASYLRMHGTIFVRKEEKSIDDETDLIDKEVLVMEGDTAHEYAIKNNLTNKIILTETFEEAMRLLSSGKHDAVIIQQLVGYQIIRKLNIKNLVDVSSIKEQSLKPIAKPLLGFEQKFCIAVPEGNRELIGLLNEGLTIVITNGIYERLYDKWFGPILPNPEVHIEDILKYLTYILIPILVIGWFLILWLLKKQITYKTKELSLANTKLSESQQRLSLAMEFANDGLFDWNLETNEIYYSPVWKRLLGYKDDELPNEFSVWENLTAPEDVKRSLKMQKELINKERNTYEIEFRMKHKMGHWVDILSRANAVFNEKGEAVRIIGTHVDISEQKKAEYLLKENEQRYKSAQRMGKVGNWEYDIATELFWGSEQAKRIFGIDPDSKTFSVEEIESCIPERERVHQALVDLIEKDIPYDLEYEIHPVSGSENRTIRSIAELSKNDSGAPLKIFGVIHDVTDEKNAQQERKKLENALNQAQKMESIGRLAGGVAHDFNNMLSIILGNAEILIEDLSSFHPSIENVREIKKAAERSTNLTRQLLAFARKQTIAPKIVDINQTIQNMLNMLERLIGEDIELSWLPGTDIWPVKIDPSQIDQILANLCVNARDAIKGVGKIIIETGHINITETYCREHAGFISGNFVLITVSDTGYGIKKGDIDKLFEPFFTTKELGAGTGLGLATVYGIVKQNNGFINVYSELNQGTVFKIYLPKHDQGSIDTNQEIMEEIGHPGNKTILLVEDEQAILIMTKSILERLGHKVLTASRPTKAIQISQEHKDIQLLITDVVMPEMNGKDLAETILKTHPTMKCLFMSGYTANVIAHRGILDGGVNFLNKPFSKHDLSAKLRGIFDKET